MHDFDQWIPGVCVDPDQQDKWTAYIADSKLPHRRILDKAYTTRADAEPAARALLLHAQAASPEEAESLMARSIRMPPPS